jgi:hypothetical protein
VVVADTSALAVQEPDSNLRATGSTPRRPKKLDSPLPGYFFRTDSGGWVLKKSKTSRNGREERIAHLSKEKYDEIRAANPGRKFKAALQEWIEKQV